MSHRLTLEEVAAELRKTGFVLIPAMHRESPIIRPSAEIRFFTKRMWLALNGHYGRASRVAQTQAAALRQNAEL